MHAIDLLTPAHVVSDASARSKKAVLDLASETLAVDEQGLDARDVFAHLCQRERWGSTAMGSGVAIPHGRMPGFERAAAAFLRLREPVDFDASDSQPVDLVFALVVPEDCEEQHLALLAQIAALFKEPDRLSALRSAGDAGEVLAILKAWQARSVAA